MNGQRITINFAFFQSQLSDGNSVINVQTDDPADKGTHDMVLEVVLSSYGKVLEQSFTIVINGGPCTITDLTVAPGQDFTIIYDIKNPAVA